MPPFFDTLSPTNTFALSNVGIPDLLLLLVAVVVLLQSDPWPVQVKKPPGRRRRSRRSHKIMGVLIGSVRQGRIVVLAVWAGALKVGLAGGNSASSPYSWCKGFGFIHHRRLQDFFLLSCNVSNIIQKKEERLLNCLKNSNCPITTNSGKAPPLFFFKLREWV